MNITLTQVGGSSSDLIGVIITITDDDDGSTLFTATWNGGTITTAIEMFTNYTISVETVAGYLACAPQSYQAGYQTERSISFQYRALGAFVEATDGTLYTAAQWSSAGKTPNSIVLLTNVCKFRIALSETKLPITSSDNFRAPLENYLTAIPSAENAKLDYDGFNNTSKIIQFNIAYNQNTTSYAAPYCRAFSFSYPHGQKGDLPALGQLWIMSQNKTEINSCLTACGGSVIASSSDFFDSYRSSTNATINSNNARCVWVVNNNNVNGGSSINDTLIIRPVCEY